MRVASQCLCMFICITDDAEQERTDTFFSQLCKILNGNNPKLYSKNFNTVSFLSEKKNM